MSTVKPGVMTVYCLVIFLLCNFYSDSFLLFGILTLRFRWKTLIDNQSRT